MAVSFIWCVELDSLIPSTPGWDPSSSWLLVNPDHVPGGGGLALYPGGPDALKSFPGLNISGWGLFPTS